MTINPTPENQPGRNSEPHGVPQAQPGQPAQPTGTGVPATSNGQAPTDGQYPTQQPDAAAPAKKSRLPLILTLSGIAVVLVVALILVLRFVVFAPASVAGTWESDFEDRSYTLELNQDGKCTLKSSRLPDKPCTWSENNGEVKLVAESSSTETVGQLQSDGTLKFKDGPVFRKK